MKKKIRVADGAMRCVATILAVLQMFPGYSQSAYAQQTTTQTVSPIQHVIVIIGENRSFDHAFGTYQPKIGQTISNLLSKGIVNVDGTPGPNYAQSAQSAALDNTTAYSNSPQTTTVYSPLPPATAGGNQVASDTTAEPFATLNVATQADQGLDGDYIPYLITGATGLTAGAPDTRIANVNNLQSGVFQLSGPTMPYDAYTNSPVHRFFQMWQQTNCSVSVATTDNPSGCQNNLFPWVETTVGVGGDGFPQSLFNLVAPAEGSSSMGFYNMAKGDASYLKSLADQYTLSDNFHQSVMGGTGANHVMFGFADAIWYSDGKGNPAVPPTSEIENPNPQSGTNNYYDQDGYAGGSYVNCGDTTQPGVAPIANYLQSLPNPIETNCQKGNYYLVNNYNPGYDGSGNILDTSLPANTYTIPPTSVRSIGDSLIASNISFKYYGEGWNWYVNPPPAEPQLAAVYCTICNPFQYSSSIMANTATRTQHIVDSTNLYSDIDANTLPAISIVKPDNFNDGHPASSKLDLFEGFVKKIVEQVESNPALVNNTAIFITFDEGGGYYDSGYIQPVDFFGDGTRIPLLVVSPYTAGGVVSHEYGDHVSIIKFIEKNWGLAPITARSRDNLPNPVQAAGGYAPTNSPAIGDLFSVFNFPNPLTASSDQLSFGNTDLNNSSASQVITVTNSSTYTSPISGITATGDFAETTTCGATLAPGASCAITVKFTPTVVGARTGALSFNSGASTMTNALTGNGVNFSASLSTASGQVVAGAALSSAPTLTLTGMGGFSSPVIITCTTKTPGSSCTPASSTVLLSGATPVNVPLTISTTPAVSQGGIGAGSSGLMLFLFLMSVGAIVWSIRKRSLLPRLTFAFLCLLLSGFASFGCSSNGTNTTKTVYANATTPGTYTYTVTATDGTVTQTENYVLTVTAQ